MVVPGAAMHTKVSGVNTIKKRWFMGILSRFAHEMQYYAYENKCCIRHYNTLVEGQTQSFCVQSDAHKHKWVSALL